MSSTHPTMIACVTFETVQIVQPTVEVGSTEVHIFHYVRDPESIKGRNYASFYEQTCRMLESSISNVHIHEHSDIKVWNYQQMLGGLYSLVYDLRQSGEHDILINVTSGTTAFAMAAQTVSREMEGVRLFMVPTEEYFIEPEDVCSRFFEDGVPVGMTKECGKMRILQEYDIDGLKKEDVLGLRMFINAYDAKKPGLSRTVVSELKDGNLWRGGNPRWDNTYFSRNFRNQWMKKGWVEKDPKKNRCYNPTEKGRNIADTFFKK